MYIVYSCWLVNAGMMSAACLYCAGLHWCTHIYMYMYINNVNWFVECVPAALGLLCLASCTVMYSMYIRIDSTIYTHVQCACTMYMCIQGKGNCDRE